LEIHVLSEKSKPLIDASVPILKAHGLAITTTFYANMFAAHPELKNMFNMGNQASGAQQQSLASAVFAYAANHANNAALAPVVSRIVHKHAAVGLKPSHYTIVGRYLLGAIGEVLGDAVTPELAAAWDEAYWLLACELIAAENRLYERAGSHPDHRQPVRIVARRQQADDVVSFELEAIGDETLASFEPGQYISVVVELEPNVFQQRQYSLSDAPNGKSWRISVKRDRGDTPNRPEGAVSNWLHENASVGDVLLVSQPYGDFVPQLHPEHPIALLSAGVGITPMISTLNALAQKNPNRKIVFGHAAQAPSHVAHVEDIERAASQIPALRTHFFVESAENAEFLARPAVPGRMDIDVILADDDHSEFEFYLCGPLPFMQAQRAALTARGVPAERIHREVFGPDLLDHILG
jgi:nitric oxide dioxygenase